jgi:hypothetical protein
LVHYQHEARTRSALCGRCNSAEGGGFGDAPDLQPHLHAHREIPPADEQQTAPPSCGPPRGTAGRAGGVVDQGDDQVQLPQSGPGEPVEELGKEGAVRRGARGLSICRCRTANWWRSVNISMSLSTSLIGSSRMRANTLDTAR